MKDGSTTTMQMERVDMCMQMETFTRVNLKTMSCMVKDFILGLMVRSIRDNFFMARNTDKESIYMRTRAYTKGNGFQTIMRVKEQ